MLEIEKNNSEKVKNRFAKLLKDWGDYNPNRLDDDIYEVWEDDDHFFVVDDGEVTCWEAGGDFFIPNKPEELIETLGAYKEEEDLV